jgi:putative transposase
MTVDYIDAHRDEFGVEPICSVLQVAPSTYYAAKTRPRSARSVTDTTTTAAIGKLHQANYSVYGARKVHAALRREGHRVHDRPVARCTVERLMRGAGLRGISRAKGPRTTIPGAGPDTRPDLVDRDFTATAPGLLWVADIT